VWNDLGEKETLDSDAGCLGGAPEKKRIANDYVWWAILTSKRCRKMATEKMENKAVVLGFWGSGGGGGKDTRGPAAGAGADNSDVAWSEKAIDLC